jgi:hypothetical protein
MRTITARLMTAQTASAPPVVSGRKFEGDRLFIVDLGKSVHAHDSPRITLAFKIEESGTGF